MKRIFLKNMIATILITAAVANINTVDAHAVWSKNSQNKWIWTENGIKATGWKKIQGKWYYFNSNGEMATGWLKDGAWYYLNSSGEMLTGWVKVSSKWYHLNSWGAMDTGWFKDSDGKWYYLNGGGDMRTGWLDVNGKKYYLQSGGAMATGKITIDGKSYTFDSSGALSGNSESSDNNTSLDKEENRKGYVITESSPLNIREKASSSSDIIGSIPRGSEIIVLGKEISGFYKIEWNNITGYASSAWISFVKPPVDSGSNSKPPADTNVTLGPIRTTAPSTSSKYYYSDSNLFYKVKLSPPFKKSDGTPIVGNCTWYAWGRIWELTGEMPTDADFRGNAYEWWQANKRTGKYKYGTTPKVGALPVWKSSLPNSGGCGHVAIVEKIQNGKVMISESSWHGSLFNYREIYNTEHLYGYIYIDEPNF
ncbi:MAG: CHAP domain-containing protein [Clostridium sp.]|nr:CHAP domain-containing protein [Clostridium sp.]